MNLSYIIFLFKSVKLIPKYFSQNKLTIRNVKSFIQGTYRLYNLKEQPQHIIEQLYFRLSKVDKDCLNNKACFCGCEIMGLISADVSCERNCYPIMMSKEVWETYKIIYEINNIKLEELKNNYNNALLNS